MPKINQEEYEILKRLIELLKKPKQYIARDEDGMLYAYRVKPTKYTNQKWVDGYQKVGVQKDLFQFIQWEDYEPYNIQELIEEYENEEFGYHIMEAARDYEQFVKESEETEVKKDIEWLKEKIKEEHEYNRAKHNKEGFEGYAHREFVFKYVLNLINQLDEPEVLSSDWVDGNKEPFHHFETKKVDYYISADLLQNLLVPKQEEMKVSKTWHDVIAQNKEEGHSLRWTLNYIDNLNVNDVDDFAKAWLAYPNIEVEEEEQKYYVQLMNNLYLKRNKHGAFGLGQVPLESDAQFTEQEIKDYDERFWPFAVKVEELEE